MACFALLVGVLVTVTLQMPTKALLESSCARACEKDACKGTLSNPIPIGEQWDSKGRYSDTGCCLGNAEACEICCPPDEPQHPVLDDRIETAREVLNWTLELVNQTKCGSFVEQKLAPFDKVDEVYFFDDSTATCHQLKENGQDRVTVGKCLPHGPGNTGHNDKEENWECLGRCGPGCSDASSVKSVNHWSKGCFIHDLCTYFTDSPQDLDSPIPGPFSSLTCRINLAYAEKAYVSEDYRWDGDSSYSNICTSAALDASLVSSQAPNANDTVMMPQTSLANTTVILP
jgi:hypothetical protein